MNNTKLLGVGMGWEMIDVELGLECFWPQGVQETQRPDLLQVMYYRAGLQSSAAVGILGVSCTLGVRCLSSIGMPLAAF